jgi:hypothetical protein
MLEIRSSSGALQPADTPVLAMAEEFSDKLVEIADEERPTNERDGGIRGRLDQKLFTVVVTTVPRK